MLLHEKLKPYRIILASQSPRRQQLLRDAGIDYQLATGYRVDEIYPETLPVETVPAYLSELKSRAYPFPLDDIDILVTADTVVCLQGEIIGKPADRQQAVAILSRLSGNRHTVITGVTLRAARAAHTFSVTSDVFFRCLTTEEIEYYIDRYQPYDKAGAYGIQEWIGYVGIRRIEGSFYNVMGLPIQQLYIKLSEFLADIQGK
ncbi:MAG: Maf family nucleotide pyrophosphatase [Rikenellaceae bacterium]|nr:Maf family nucleotide pyrophosphatase [Rikenellaceae bacterium]